MKWSQHPGLISVIAVAMLVQFQATRASGETLHIETRDGPREAIVMTTSVASAPTVIVLHGATVTAVQTVRSSGFAEAAAARGFVSVFPQGIRRQWNDGREKGAMANIDDVEFIRALIDDLAQRRVAARDRIYIAGVSNGGMMTFRLLCEASPLFAGAVTIIANMPAPTGANCRPSKAVPLVMFNGTGDPIVPYAGGRVGFYGMRGEVWSAEGTAQFFASTARCNKSREVEVAIEPQAQSDLRIGRLDWGLCPKSRGVALFRLQGAGHQVPGGTTFLPRLLGSNTPGIKAADIALDFFSHQRAQGERR